MEATRVCSRTGCDRIAVAVFGFQSLDCLVWLDPIMGSARGAGLLCELHADRLTPPRGWNLIDRRAPESRLWTGRPPVAPVGIRPVRRERAARPRRCATPGPSLPFDAVSADHEPTPAIFAALATPAAVAAVAPVPWSPRDTPGPELARVLDARTPLLSRAFEAARGTTVRT